MTHNHCAFAAGPHAPGGRSCSNGTAAASSSTAGRKRAH